MKHLVTLGLFLLVQGFLWAQSRPEWGIAVRAGTYTYGQSIRTVELGQSPGFHLALGGYGRFKVEGRRVVFSSEWLLTSSEYKHLEKCPAWLPSRREYKVQTASLDLPLKLHFISKPKHWIGEWYLGCSLNLVYHIDISPDYLEGPSFSSVAPSANFNPKKIYTQWTWLFGLAFSLPGHNRIGVGMQVGTPPADSPTYTYVCSRSTGSAFFTSSTTWNLIPLQSVQIQLNHALFQRP